MHKTTRLVGTLITAVALLALPVAAEAGPGKGKSKSQAKSKKGSKGSSKRCGKTPRVGYTISGTLLELTMDDPNTSDNEGTIKISVTGANSHARKSGEIADQDPNAGGVQVAGAEYTVTTDDRYTLTLEGFEGEDTPSPGDAVKIIGKVARTKAKCADGASLADRYATPDVRKVTVTDSDAD